MNNNMENNIQSVLNSATNELLDLDTAHLDAEILLQSVLGCDRSHFYSHPEKMVPDDKLESYQSLLSLRAKGTPVAYLTGQKEFWSLTLKVTDDTLIPRPETELLVEHALELIPDDAPLNVLDMGTGTGAIALSIARERPQLNIIASDISERTLDIARSNAKLNKISNVKFIHSNWFSEIKDGPFDLIICNPPYIAEQDTHLQEGDVRYEPRQALVSGPEGLDDLRIIIQQSPDFLKHGGHMLLEHGYQQGQKITELLKSFHYSEINILRDMAGHHRSTTAIFNHE